MPFRSKAILAINPPVGGIVRKTSFQTQAPFTSYDSVNFWPSDAKSGRGISGIRPPLQELVTPAAFNGLQRINMITPVNGAFSGKPFQSLVISVNGKLYWWDGSAWVAATGAQSEAVTTNRAIYASSFLSKTYIPIDTGKPIVFNYETGAAATLVETAGTVPSDTRMSAIWQGCLWLAGGAANPHILYASRTGDAEDWNFAAPLDDLAGAFFTTGENEGLLAGPITAIMPQTAETMIVSTLEGLLAMRGHPRRGGVFEPLGGVFTVQGHGAWCKLPNGVLFFLSKQGLVRLEPNSSTPTMVSREKIPMELVGLLYDYQFPKVSMSYDSRFDGIILTVRGNGQDQAWWYDVNNGGFHRMNFFGLPWVLHEHVPFVTETASGVLHGRQDGLWRMDMFSTDEDISSSLIVGPIRITQNDTERAKVEKFRVNFGRTTPSDDAEGLISLAVGTDGQDAISRLVNGEAQYTVGLDTLQHGNSLTYPMVSGGALAIGISQESGDTAIEQFTIEVVPSGFQFELRTSQIEITGTPSSISSSLAFDPLLWGGYSEATPDAASESLPDHTLFVDLSTLPSSWWDAVDPSGGDVRASTTSNTELPVDLIRFDPVNREGFATIKVSQDTSPTAVRLWAGRSGMQRPATDNAFGQFNAYDANWFGFWPHGGGDDRTSNENHLTHTNSTAADSDGVIGALATNYNEANHGAADSWAHVDNPGILNIPITLIAAAKRDNLTASDSTMMGVGSAFTDFINFRLIRKTVAPGLDEGRSDYTSDGDVVNEVITGPSGFLANTWHHIAGKDVATNARSTFINGGQKAGSTTSVVHANFTFFVLGRHTKATPSTTFAGNVSLAQLHNVARSDGWIAYQASMMNQAAFWNGWAAFVVVNPDDTLEEPNLLTSACPTGEVPVSETGTWSGYALATSTAVPATTEGVAFLPRFTYFVDLSKLPASWWSAVASDGKDIRVTDSNNVFLPSDLINFDSALDTGFLTFRSGASTAAGQTVRIWVGNASAVVVPACAKYGRYRTYDEFTHGFWPSGAGTDRSQYANSLTAAGGLTDGGQAGPAGNKASRYDGVDDNATVSLSSSTLDEPPLTLSSVVRVNAPDVYDVAAIASVDNVALQHYAINTIETDEPLVMSASGNTAIWQVLQKTPSIDAWTQVAISFRRNDVDGGMAARIVSDTTVNSVVGTQTSIIPRITDLNGLIVGALRKGVTNPQLFFDGDITLARLDNTFRPVAWSAYVMDMLDQTTFWDTWAWVASSSSLPQP